MAFRDTLKSEKGMYITGKGFTRTLKELGPSMDYEGTPLSGLDAYQRQLKHFDIRVGGPGSDPMEKFFQTSNGVALFPKYVSRVVRQGMERTNLLPGIVATVMKISSMDYRTITSDPLPQDKGLLPTVEGAKIPRTVAKAQENLVRLHKHGRMLVASYEALRFQKLDLFTVTPRQIGAYTVRVQFDDAVGVLLNGNGNDNPAPVTDMTDEFSYQNMVSLWSVLQPYKLDIILAFTPMIEDIPNLGELQDSMAGLGFRGTGELVMPLGAKLLHVPSLSGSRLVGLDKNCALGVVQAGDVLTDSDKLIDRQLERTSISVIVGFTKIFAGTCRAVSYTGE